MTKPVRRPRPGPAPEGSQPVGKPAAGRPGGDRPGPGRSSPEKLASSTAAAPDGPIRSPMLALGYLIFALAGVLCAAYEVLLVPSRLGSTLIPIAPVLAIVSNLVLPQLSRSLTNTTSSALPPVIGWFAATFVLASGRPEGDVLLPAGDTAWVSYGLLICGALAALLTLAAGDRPAQWLARRRQRSGTTGTGRFSRPGRRPVPPGSDSDGAT